MSSFTTTGATVLNNIEAQYQSILIWRNFSQWLGGMGIITLFVALFPMLGMGAAHLVDAELPGPQTEKLTVRLRDTIKSLWFLYLGFSVVEFLLLWQAGRLPVFDSVIITFGTMPTGGFAATSLSIGAYNSVIVDVIVIVFMAIAGVNFGLHYLFLGRRQPSHLFNNPEFRIYIILLVGASVLIASNLMHVMALPAADSFRHGFFQSVSIMTTTGFSTVDFNLWPSFSRTVLLMLMIIGASSGSTGGALKITRFIVLFKYTFRRISLTFNPQAVIPIKVGGTVLNERVISGIIGMAVLYFTCIFVGFLIMAGLGLDPVSALSSVLATLGNIGPGLGVVGPLASYAAIPAVGKVVLILAMLAGRLELMTIFALLAPSFWKWR
jgi:trk system potassium uptake protein TrkH